MSDRSISLEALEDQGAFIRRHIGPSETDVQEMLGVLGLPNLDALIERAVPESIRSRLPASFGAARSEADVLEELRQLAAKNRVNRSLIGLGYYDTITPPVILRNVLENPGWYTAYTPYQPEIAQGRLEALLNYQTMVIDLTGLEIANASMLDESTAAAEAMTMSHALAKNGANAFFVSALCLPQTIAVVETRAHVLGIKVIVGDHRNALGAEKLFGALLQYPATDGAIHDYAETIKAVQAQGGLVTMASDLLALMLLKPPGELGADIAVGSAQRFGVPMGFGGPHAAFFATKDAHKRSMPGRLVGVSVDTKGRPALRLALQTREQHIRREKATSNICTAQVLLANMASLYAVYHGPQGLRRIAQRVHRLSAICAEGFKRLGLRIVNDSFFDTLTVEAKGEARPIAARAEASGYNVRLIDENRFGVSFDETTVKDDVIALWRAVKAALPAGLDIASLDKEVKSGIPAALARESQVLAHPTFNRYHAETEMLRYLRKLMDKDIALDRAMIPLGSCTMKLNATTEMIPITWPGFARMHPFAPPSQTEGYRALVSGLETMLANITGFAAVSIQPNAGSQGEYAGLLVIRAFHEARGQGHRNICLIPSSAHGTNPASAVMAGLKVVVVGCDAQGNVDVDDLSAKASQHANDLAALMITYPSTHGVFETRIVEICEIVHQAGGQVYMDGANMNALVGLAQPGAFGPDVMHLNLHKTFCIPHGGGGPGVGPIAVAKHLAPHLPNHPLRADAGPAGGIGPISAAPFGSAAILPISYAYIAMMGAEGLTRASAVAILSANYLAKKLSPHYPVLYTGAHGLVAHECIIDCRAFKESADIGVDDIAKRLMDYGFHAPTMSWPVAGTLMIEPTESEAKIELDRFIEAMASIRGEIRRIEQGALDRKDNPLKHSPHTVADIAVENWIFKHTREEAAFPVAGLKDGSKYWPPVNRIDQVYGDRNLVCACPPLDAYKNAAE
ncbi:MAG: glycine dehydrogenase (aminomethyl-transferring) [Alphaproteobacteria bacterium]|nr:glycine dehydrogenase (aminomethyl-transferring) [Alphaproteobacteria bacterium]